VIIAIIAGILAIGVGWFGAPALAQTTVVPRTTITVDEQPMVVQPAPFGPATPTPPPTPAPGQPRRHNQQVQQQMQPALGAAPAPVPAAAPAPRPQGPRRPSNGYSSFLTGPIDLTRPPVPQQ
jgi:hypothetical protein